MSTITDGGGRGNRDLDDVVDHTAPDGDDCDAAGGGDGSGGVDQGAVRLRTGIDVRQLLEQREGVMFEPEIDEALFRPRSDVQERNYFDIGDDAGESRWEEAMERLRLDDNILDNEDDDDDTYDAKATKMSDVTPDGLIKKRILFLGNTACGLPPARGTVTVHYSFYLEGQDEPFDSSVLRGRAERFRLDDGRMIPGVEAAVKSMMKRERAEFLIWWQHAFGEMGCPPRVPGRAVVLARIELLDFVQEEEAEALLAMDAEERGKKKTFDDIEKVVRREHLEGNEQAKREEFKLAARRYERGIRLLEDAELKDDAEQARQERLLLKLYLNRAYCCVKLHWPKKACMDLKRALNRDPNNPKALYRMGLAKRMLGHYEDAMHYLQRARRAAPADVDIGRELAHLDGIVARQRDEEVNMCQRMFQGRGESSRPPPRDLAADVDDEVYHEMYAQLEGFLKDAGRACLPLPSSLNAAEVALARNVCASLGLKVRDVRRGSHVHWEVYKADDNYSA